MPAAHAWRHGERAAGVRGLGVRGRRGWAQGANNSSEPSFIAHMVHTWSQQMHPSPPTAVVVGDGKAIVDGRATAAAAAAVAALLGTGHRWMAGTHVSRKEQAEQGEAVSTSTAASALACNPHQTCNEARHAHQNRPSPAAGRVPLTRSLRRTRAVASWSLPHTYYEHVTFHTSYQAHKGHTCGSR